MKYLWRKLKERKFTWKRGPVAIVLHLTDIDPTDKNMAVGVTLAGGHVKLNVGVGLTWGKRDG